MAIAVNIFLIFVRVSLFTIFSHFYSGDAIYPRTNSILRLCDRKIVVDLLNQLSPTYVTLAILGNLVTP